VCQCVTANSACVDQSNGEMTVTVPPIGTAEPEVSGISPTTIVAAAAGSAVGAVATLVAVVLFVRFRKRKTGQDAPGDVALQQQQSTASNSEYGQLRASTVEDAVEGATYGNSGIQPAQYDAAPPVTDIASPYSPIPARNTLALPSLPLPPPPAH
jgi:hypothetical protein